MRYGDDDEVSRNVERAPRGRFPFPGGGGQRIQIPIGGRGGMSLTTLLILGAVMLFFGINPLEVLFGGGNINIPQLPQSGPMEPGPGRQSGEARPREGSPFELPGTPRQQGQGQGQGADRAAMERFVGQVLRDTEIVWDKVFQSFGRKYEQPKLKLFDGVVESGCGFGQAAMGPFYCPRDQNIYIDLSFYTELSRRFGAPGDFAQAYVIAHEVGHHVQKLLGIADQVEQAREGMSERESNRLQVRMELQADCLAGVWANVTDEIKNRLEPGDIEEGMNAAEAIGDDMIQKKAQGRVVPDAFTHGSSAQRVRWFKEGFSTGQIQSCDTFNTDNL